MVHKLIVLSLFCCSFLAGDSVHVEIANKIVKKTIKEVRRKYSLAFVGEGAGMMDSVNYMSLFFESKKIIEEDRARELALNCSDLFLNNINSDEKIHSYLISYPFPVENIEVSIFFPKNSGEKISCIACCDGKLKYYKHPSENLVSELYKTETLAEAREKVKQSKAS